MSVAAAVPGPRTIERALGILDAFRPSANRWREAELADRCGLPVPTTHRMLKMLASFGYVAREPGSGVYTLGPAAARFARHEPMPVELGEAALPALRAVARATGERAALAALAESRDHALEVCAVSAGEQASAVPPDPEIHPLHAGAAAKVLLAEISSAEFAKLVGRGLDPVGPATITRPPRLRREVAAIRRRGWAFSCQERMPQRWALAVPIRTPGGAASALAISAPLGRFDRDRARRHLSVLNLAAGALAERLRARETKRGEPRCQTA